MSSILQPTRRRLLPPCAVIVALVLTACRREPPPPAEPAVATVNGQAITLKSFATEVDRRAKTGAEVDPVKMLDDLVRREALVARAEQEGFTNRPEIRAAIRELIAARWYEEKLAAVPPPPTVAETEVRERYEMEKAVAVRPEALSIAVLRLEWNPKATDEIKAERLALANRLREQARSLPGGFGALAEAHSTHQATRYRGGELGWLTRPQIELFVAAPELAAAVFALRESGDLTAPLPARDGLYLFRLIGRRPAQPIPYEERRLVLQQKLAYERQRVREADVQRTAQQGIAITVNRELVATLKPVRTNAVAAPSAMPKP